MLQFDPKGFLIPDQRMDCTLEELRQVFVESVPDDQREKLFAGLLTFLKDLFAGLPVEEVVVWIDGSFTTKKRNPNDIDLVYFLDAETTAKYEGMLGDHFSSPESLNLYGIDAYLVRVYTESHPLYFCTQADRAYWMYFFTKTRKDRRGNTHKKGFLELKISRHDIIA
ncbi:MAG: hypothetical protein KAX50_10145 [Saprospiraceae bacterium]|nr:hypothetical protein [Saprospiraceae bacterium]